MEGYLDLINRLFQSKAFESTIYSYAGGDVHKVNEIKRIFRDSVEQYAKSQLEKRELKVRMVTALEKLASVVCVNEDCGNNPCIPPTVTECKEKKKRTYKKKEKKEEQQEFNQEPACATQTTSLSEKIEEAERSGALTRMIGNQSQHQGQELTQCLRCGRQLFWIPIPGYSGALCSQCHSAEKSSQCIKGLPANQCKRTSDGQCAPCDTPKAKKYKNVEQ